jgi:hypothetical protein
VTLRAGPWVKRFKEGFRLQNFAEKKNLKKISFGYKYIILLHILSKTMLLNISSTLDLGNI